MTTRHTSRFASEDRNRPGDYLSPPYRSPATPADPVKRTPPKKAMESNLSIGGRSILLLVFTAALLHAPGIVRAQFAPCDPGFKEYGAYCIKGAPPDFAKCEHEFDMDSCTRVIESNRSVINAYQAKLLGIRAVHFHTTGDYDRAIADSSDQIRILQALGVNIDMKFELSQAFKQRGRSYERKGDNERALSDYGEVIKLNPKDGWMLRGDLYAKMGDCRRAVVDYGEAIRAASYEGRPYFVREIGRSRSRTRRLQRVAMDWCFR
jgi:tetratricopeptide (TPR) repeat protein